MVAHLNPRRINYGRYRFPGELFDCRKKDDFGGSDERPERLRTIWIDFRTRPGNESVDGEQVASVDVFEFRTPWTPDRLTSGMQIRWNGDEYEIESVLDSDAQNVELILVVRRRNIARTEAERRTRFA